MRAEHQPVRVGRAGRDRARRSRARGRPGHRRPPPGAHAERQAGDACARHAAGSGHRREPPRQPRPAPAERHGWPLSRVRPPPQRVRDLRHIGCLWLVPQPRKQFVEMTKALLEIYPEIELIHRRPRPRSVPHVTIGSRLTEEQQRRSSVSCSRSCRSAEESTASSCTSATRRVDGGPGRRSHYSERAMTAVLFTCSGRRVDIVTAFGRAGATTVATDVEPARTDALPRRPPRVRAARKRSRLHPEAQRGNRDLQRKSSSCL